MYLNYSYNNDNIDISNIKTMKNHKIDTHPNYSHDNDNVASGFQAIRISKGHISKMKV